jgi:hypothetical protein
VVLVAAAVVFVAALAAVLVSIADSGSKKKLTVAQPKARPTTKSLTLVVGAVDVQSAGPPATVSPGVRRALMRATQQYFDDAIQGPLRHKAVNVAYTQVFDPGVKGDAAGRDRAALTESATGVIRGAAHLLATPVRIDGLGDPTGKLVLAATTFALQAKANTPTGPLTIRRHTELTFANEFGKWVVTAYRVTVRRSIGPSATASTVHSGTT